jgi:hypothetical protein
MIILLLRDSGFLPREREAQEPNNVKCGRPSIAGADARSGSLDHRRRRQTDRQVGKEAGCADRSMEDHEPKPPACLKLKPLLCCQDPPIQLFFIYTHTHMAIIRTPATTLLTI